MNNFYFCLVVCTKAQTLDLFYGIILGAILVQSQQNKK